MVTAALYLACKVEEQPRSLTRVTQTVYSSAYAGRTLALKLIMKQVKHFGNRLVDAHGKFDGVADLLAVLLWECW